VFVFTREMRGTSKFQRDVWGLLFVVCCLVFGVWCLVFGAFCLTCYRCSETGLLIRPAVVDALKIMGFLFFFLDEKEPKNQENFKLPNALDALPAKFSGQRTIFPKEIFMGAGIFVFCLLSRIAVLSGLIRPSFFSSLHS
jgi:hypothetical protein